MLLKAVLLIDNFSSRSMKKTEFPVPRELPLLTGTQQSSPQESCSS